MSSCRKDLLKKKRDMIIIFKKNLDREIGSDKYDPLITNSCVDDFLAVVCVVFIYIILVVIIGSLHK